MPINDSAYSPEVTEYMTLNGYRLVTHDKELDMLSFRKGDVGVVFWQDRIERRIISPDKLAVTRNLKAFKGFDGKDMLCLMWVLHFLDAVNLKDVRREVRNAMIGEVRNEYSEMINGI